MGIKYEPSDSTPHISFPVAGKPGRKLIVKSAKGVCVEGLYMPAGAVAEATYTEEGRTVDIIYAGKLP